MALPIPEMMHSMHNAAVATIVHPAEYLRFTINWITLPTIKHDECYKYVGGPIGIDYDQTPYTYLEQMLSDMQNVTICIIIIITIINTPKNILKIYVLPQESKVMILL